MSVTCAKCDSEVARRLKSSHNCVKVLKGVISEYSKIISHQQEIIEKLMAGYAGAEGGGVNRSVADTLESTQMFQSDYGGGDMGLPNVIEEVGYQRRNNPFRVQGTTDFSSSASIM